MPVKGGKELSAALKRMGPAAGGKALRSAAVSSMLPVVKRAKAFAPTRDSDGSPRKTYKGRIAAPGFLSRNIGRKSFLKTKSLVRVLVGPKAEAFYGTVFVEKGTRHQPAQPWLEPAFEVSIPEVDARMQARLKALIAKAAKR